MESPTEPRLEILKVLGDNTRYAIYLELARAPQPLATADIAKSLGLHPNTVRPQLERMRELGLLEQITESRGGVGRPQHRYKLAPDSPSLGFEPPVFPLLSRMLLRVAAEAGATGDDAADAGWQQGRDAAARWSGTPCGAALVGELARLGFDPEVADDEHCVTIGFTHCPFRDLAEANPSLVCGLHRGLVQGLIDTLGDGQMLEFRSLVDRNPCQVDIDTLVPTA